MRGPGSSQQQMKEIGPNTGDHGPETDFQARHKKTDADTDNTVFLFASEVEKSRSNFNLLCSGPDSGRQRG